MKIIRVQPNNGKTLPDRLLCLRKGSPTGQYEFGPALAEIDIEHHLAPLMRPQTNGIVEQFSGRIMNVLQSHRFQGGEDIEQTVLRHVHLYNSQFPQTVLKGRPLIGTLKD